MKDYPLLNLFWTMLWLFLWIAWIFLLIRVVGDVFRSPDLGGGMKAAWTLGLVLFPYLGVLVYLIARGGAMHERDVKQATDNEAALQQYLRHVAGSGPSTADELGKLAALRDSGVLTTEEFDRQKAKLLV